MPEIGWAGLGVVPEVDSDFYRKLTRDVDPALARAGKSSGARFGSVLGKAAAVGLTGALGAGFAAFKLGKDAVGLAANFEQSVGAVDAIFEKSSKKIHRWADDAATDVGLSAGEFNELGTLIGAQLKNGGTAMDDLAPKTRELITAGADMAAMFGGTTKDAVDALSSALKGERDPIERYGVSLTQAKIDAEAAELGFEKVDGALSSQATQAATLSLIMEQTADAHGRFADESDTLAGKQQRLSARFEDVKTELGTALLPIITEATEYLLEEGVPAFEKFSDWFADDGIDGLKRFGTFTKDEVLPVVEDLGGFLKDAAGFGEDVVKFLNDLPDPAKYAALAALVGGVGVAKLRGGGGGALAGAGKVLGLAKPVPVFVTNPGFGGSGVPGVVPGGKPSKVAKVAKTGAKAIPILSTVAIGYELGGDEFGAGARNSGILGGLGDIRGLKEKADEGAAAVGDSFRQVYDQAAAAFREADLPTEFKFRIATEGAPETNREIRALVREFDLVPAQKRTAFELLGYDRLRDQIARINAEMDHAARPRETRIDITRAFHEAGYQTRGGLQERSGIGGERAAAIGGFPQ